jgi:hypothetical protein
MCSFEDGSRFVGYLASIIAPSSLEGMAAAPGDGCPPQLRRSPRRADPEFPAPATGGTSGGGSWSWGSEHQPLSLSGDRQRAGETQILHTLIRRFLHLRPTVNARIFTTQGLESSFSSSEGGRTPWLGAFRAQRPKRAKNDACKT